MLLSARFTIALTLVICGVGLCSLAAAQEAQTRKVPSGSISGKVTIQGHGAPGIVVGLRYTDPDSQREPMLKATTDANGNFRIVGAPGRCQVAPIAPGFVVIDFAFNAQGKTIVIAKGETVDGIDFALIPGGAITGKVSDAEGRPVVEERVILLPSDSPSSQGVRTTSPDTSRIGQTDDRGIYRIFGLKAGHYKVAVSNSLTGVEVTARKPPYEKTFYPDTTNISKAIAVEVTAGGETANIDIVVGRTLPTFGAGGRIVDGVTGKPVVNLRWGLPRISDSTR